MANRFNTVIHPNLLTSLGGVLNAGDSVYISQPGTQITGGNDLSATDLLLFRLGERWATDIESPALKLVCNRTGTGAFENLSSARMIFLTSTGPAGVIDTIRHLPSVAEGRLDLQNCKVGDLFAVGPAELYDTVDCDNLVVRGSARVKVREAASFPLTSLIADGHARVDLQRACSGALEVRGAATVIFDNDLITLANIDMRSADGTMRIDDIAGITALDWSAGLLDLSRLSRPLDLSAATVILGDPADCKIRYPQDDKSMVTWPASPTFLSSRDPR